MNSSGSKRLRIAVGLGHAASRSAVSRISAIMLGMPWVRFELSWLLRSKRASAPSMSSARISAGRPVLHGEQDQGDDALGDRGIAVGEEMEPAVGLRHRIDPDRGRAAAHQGRVGLERVRHRLQRPAEIDQQPVAVVRFEQLVIGIDVVEGVEGHGASA